VVDAIAVSRWRRFATWPANPTDRLLILGDGPSNGAVAFILYHVTKKHEDTTVNLDMPFDEAIRRLAQPKRKGSQAEESGSTKSDGDRSPERPKSRTAPRPKSSGD